MSRVLFDEGVPNRLRRYLIGHEVETVQECGWGGLKNGDLLRNAGAADFHVFVTSDKNIQHQQNLGLYRLAIVVLGTNIWPTIAANPGRVAVAVDGAVPGLITTVEFPRRPRPGPSP